MAIQDLKIGDRIASQRLYFKVGTLISIQDGGFLVKSDGEYPVVLYVSNTDAFLKIQ
jgi:hypothetical protein